MKIFSACSLLVVCLSVACSRQEYGFVARLGTDTISVERITRTSDRISSDVVERSPRVMRKRWEASLDGDGRLRSWTMSKQLMNPAPGEPASATYRMDFNGDSVLITEENGGAARRYQVSDVLPVTVPWESYVYGLYELLFERALEQPQDSVPVRQYNPGRGLLRGLVRKQSGDSLTFVTGGRAGTGVARVDPEHRMSSYSGRFTTYKQEVERVRAAPDIDAIAERFAAEERSAPARSMSVRDTAEYTVGNARITIDSGRPLRRGRTILGNVVPYDAVWRTGANAATQLTTSAPISIAGLDLLPGTYTLWTLPRSEGAQLIINRQTGQWGTRYNPQLDLGRVPFRAAFVTAPVDTFTIRIAADTLVVEWDRFRWSVPVTAR